MQDMIVAAVIQGALLVALPSFIIGFHVVRMAYEPPRSGWGAYLAIPAACGLVLIWVHMGYGIIWPWRRVPALYLIPTGFILGAVAQVVLREIRAQFGK